MRMSKNYKYKIIAAVIIAVIAFVSTYGCNKSEVPDRKEGVLYVHFLDVGEADSTYIEFPDGKTMLIDAGEIENGAGVINYIKSRGTTRLDFVVGTHPHADHIGGLIQAVNDFEIGKFYMPKTYQNTNVFENLLIAVKDKGLKINSPVAGDYIYKTEDLYVKVLSPENKEYNSPNDYSIVIKIVYRDTAFLLTGDAENEVLRAIGDDVSADVLKVAHHGSDTSGSRGFMKRVSPEYAVISVGTDNQYGHPHREVLDLLDDVGARVYRTDEDGTVIISSDGEKIKAVTLGVGK